MISIQPQYLTLAKLLDGRLFRIPEYQRAYSWTKNQRKDLFDDIKKVYEKGSDAGHFMAAVVCLRRNKQVLGTDEFHVLEVVDGQQRLTTLIILLNTIKLALDQENKAEEKILRELNDLLVKAESDELLLLQTNHDSSHFFANFLRHGSKHPSKKAATIADREILEAVEDCERFVEYWKNKNDDLLSLVALLKNRLFLLLHEIDDEKTVYTVFEVLNSRGLDVSWLDRLKSILMGAAFELNNMDQEQIIEDLHTIWRDIYNVIGLRQGMSTEMLRFAASLRLPYPPSRPSGEQDSVDFLRSKANTAKEIREVASWLLRVTKACDAVAANKRINAVTKISQARLLATAIHLREDFTENEKEILLSFWEKISFRIYGMLKNDARTRVGDYVRLAWSVANNKRNEKETIAGIKEIGNDFPIEKAIDSLRNTNCYESWENELRYIMFRYEEYLTKQQNLNFSNEQWEKIWMVSPSDSIEHIWSNSQADYRYKHRLGNLTLLPPKLNSRLNYAKPKDKVDDYFKCGLLITSKVADKIRLGGWDEDAIEERENELLTWAANEWGD
jgi:Protein of unknown function DUF262/Protein of unknown function (DUF1524)